MSTYYVDLKYVKLLGGRLLNFKQKKDAVFAFSHSCEDHQSSRKIQARGNFFKRDDQLMFHCYHCGASNSFQNFLKGEDPTLFQEYRMETFKENKGGFSKPLFSSPKPVVIKKEEQIKNKIDPEVIMLPDLPLTGGVMKYITSRKIPEEYWDRIGIVKDFNGFASKYDDIFKGLNKTHPRLVFPFYDQDESIICYSCRSFGKEQPKYITLMVDKSRPKIYGLWKVNTEKHILAVEGQIDSLFLDNAIAVNGSDYDLPFLAEHKSKIIIIPDSDWKRNRQIFKSLEKIIDKGYKVSLLPESVPWKDINDCAVMGRFTKDKIMDLVMSNITDGLKAKIEINYRKKF